MTAQPEVFDASVYDLPIPKVDGIKADKLAIVLTGSIDIDRTNNDDLELLNQFMLGKPCQLIVEAVCVGKSSSYRPDDDGAGTLTQRTVLRITSINPLDP